MLKSKRKETANKNARRNYAEEHHYHQLFVPKKVEDNFNFGDEVKKAVDAFCVDRT